MARDFGQSDGDQTQHQSFERRGWRSGSDYYGNDPRRYGQSFQGVGPRNFSRSDERIRELVCEALTDDPTVDASNIEVVVQQSEVILSGQVTTREQRRLAESVAAAVSGVRDVRNNLQAPSNRGDESLDRDSQRWLRD